MSTHSLKRVFMEGKTKKFQIFQRITFAVGIALIVFFGFILICNLIIIVKSTLQPNDPPALFGLMPMVVMSGSMSGNAVDHIEEDDLIFISKVDHKKLEVGNIIAYKKDDKTIITHRIVLIETVDNNELRFITKGDANNVNDDPISKNEIIGIYMWRIPKLGRLVMFMQTPIGVVLAVGIPIIGFFTFDFIFRRKRKKER